MLALRQSLLERGDEVVGRVGQGLGLQETRDQSKNIDQIVR